MTESAKIVLKSPAKINLYLEVMSRRENGYHDLKSVMAPVSIYDEIEMEKTASGVECEIENDGLSNGSRLVLEKGDDNIAVKAAVLLREKTGCSAGVKIRLKKRIPVGGGLGGGSSNAAAVLTGLNELWKTGLSKENLVKLAFSLGSDVPGLTYGGQVCIEGLGDMVKPFCWNGQGLWVVIVNPGFSISTKDIYSRVSSSLTSEGIPFSSIASALESRDPMRVAGSLRNDLQEIVFRKYPLVEMIAGDLKSAGALGVLLSGSGASIFGLAEDREHAVRVAEDVKRLSKVSLWCKVATTLPDGVMVAHGPLEA